jgi:hypothetical protein
MRVLLTLLFALFVAVMWLIYGTSMGPFDWSSRGIIGAVVGIVFMAVLVVIGFRVDGAHRRP